MTDRPRFTARNGIDTWVLYDHDPETWDGREPPPSLSCEKGYGDNLDVEVDAATGEFVIDFQCNDYTTGCMVNIPVEAWTAFVAAAEAWHSRRAGR
jgi:hypothetical protein